MVFVVLVARQYFGVDISNDWCILLFPSLQPLP